MSRREPLGQPQEVRYPRDHRVTVPNVLTDKMHEDWLVVRLDDPEKGQVHACFYRHRPKHEKDDCWSAIYRCGTGHVYVDLHGRPGEHVVPFDPVSVPDGLDVPPAGTLVRYLPRNPTPEPESGSGFYFIRSVTVNGQDFKVVEYPEAHLRAFMPIGPNARALFAKEALDWGALHREADAARDLTLRALAGDEAARDELRAAAKERAADAKTREAEQLELARLREVVAADPADEAALSWNAELGCYQPVSMTQAAPADDEAAGHGLDGCDMAQFDAYMRRRFGLTPIE